ncbi:MAG: LysR family transcriptional regulator [Chloroflexi bacterium]|nr:LysR family transcriptional regulator [Chloroflexota bacterium]
MNLKQLLYFYAVGRAGSYSRAAEEVGVSEPVVHRAVRSLEKSCGLRLLQRKGNGVRVTPEGERILEYGSRIASLADMAEQAVAEQKANVFGKLSMGVGVTALLYLLPAVLPRWIAEHPLVNISVTQGMGRELQDALLRGDLDLFVSSGTNWDPRLRKELVFSDKLVVVARAGHPLGERSFVTMTELSTERLVLPKSSLIRDETYAIERQYGVQFKLAAEVNRVDVAKPLCKAGIGPGVFMMSSVTEEIRSGQLLLLNVEGFPRSWPYFLVYRGDKAVTPEMRSLFFTIRLWAEQRNWTAQNDHIGAPPSGREQGTGKS